MSITTCGPGDEQTWGPCVGHPNDPRAESEDGEENDFDRRTREQADYDDWYASRKADQAAEDHFAARDEP
jgi:hypothetical protein